MEFGGIFLQLSVILGTLVTDCRSEILSICKFIKQLHQAQVPEKDWAKWLCAAQTKSKMDTTWVGRSVGVSPGCNNKSYGIFQIDSEYCEDDDNKDNCQSNPCDTICNYFRAGDIQDDIKCVQTLLIKRDKYSSQFFSHCVAQKNNTQIDLCKDNETAPESSVSHAINYIILVGIIALVIIAFIIVWRKKRDYQKKGLSYNEINRFRYGDTYGSVKHKRNTQSVLLQKLQESEDTFNSNPYDKTLEVPTSDYEIYPTEVLGSGAYGIVVKGSVRSEPVAVKTVKPSSNKEFVLSLLEEIKVMSYLGKHENILGLVGANTTLLRRGIVYVFVQFCPLGSLEKVLKDNRSSFVDLLKNDRFMTDSSKDDIKTISSRTLLIWANQIANAMQYLASKKVIHGDLATRNVLLQSKQVIKISDFGLSRKLYSYSNYIKTKEEPLPWRHMSLEALRDMNFSTQSDVWAFGVTLWEMFNLGDLPYPGKNFSLTFVDELMAGLRMPKPRYATTELYQTLMLQAWNESPKDRPSFEWFCIYLHKAVEQVDTQEYATLDRYT